MVNLSNVAKEARRREAAEQLLHRRKCRSDLTYFATDAIRDFTMPGMQSFAPARHHLLLLDKLKDVADGKINKLMVFMPPGSAKSSYASIIFPAWFMAKNPKSQIIGASSASNLAEDFSRKVQNLMRARQIELDVKPLNESAQLWTASNLSRYLSAGIGGSITGFRADLAIIDDPIKSYEQAYSERVRESNWGWWRTTLHTRILPTASIVLIQTRWHLDDLAGRLLETQANEWTVLNLPAIWDQTKPDALGRQFGDLLWPEWQDQKFIDDQRRTLGEREFHAMYQQNPRPQEGSIFKTQYLKFTETSSTLQGQLIRGWDLAATVASGTRDPDWTVGVLMQRRPDDSICVLDMVRFREGPEGVRQHIKATAEKDGKNIKISIPQDPGAGGKYVVADLMKMLMGWYVESSLESGEKATRAMPFSAQVNSGNVTLLRRPWNEVFIDELQGFPGLKHDDIIDSCSRCFYGLTTIGSVPKVIDTTWMSR